VSSTGSPYTGFRRSLETGRLSIVLMAAAELSWVGAGGRPGDPRAHGAERDPCFDRAAALWVRRLLTERSLGLSDARLALALVERLQRGRESLHWLTRRR
jgi:hypothetical protein